MAITVNMYTLSKRANSTKKPVGNGTMFNCAIKEPSSILEPVLKLNLGLTTAPTNLNYAYIPAFNRYYYIVEWTYEESLWVAQLRVDHLASWKDQIGMSQCYVLRSSSASNGNILDTAYPVTGLTTYTEVTGDRSPWRTNHLSNGTYVLGVAGQTTTYHAFEELELESFFEYLFSDDYAEDLTDNWSNVFPQFKAQSNPLQYITSLIWLPFTISKPSETGINVGWARVPCLSSRIDDSGLESGIMEFRIASHPQSSRGSFLNNTPYSSYSLYFPPWGLIKLDSDMIANSSVLSASWDVDLRTGQGTLTISIESNTSTHILSWIHSQIGIPFQVSQVVSKGFGLGNLINPIANIGASIATGNYGGTITSTVSEIGNFASSKIPSATTIGSTGSMNALIGRPVLQCEWKHIVSEDNEHKGRPLCQIRRLNTLSGFILVADGDLEIEATRNELDRIKTDLEGGFFYE